MWVSIFLLISLLVCHDPFIFQSEAEIVTLSDKTKYFKYRVIVSYIYTAVRFDGHFHYVLIFH